MLGRKLKEWVEFSQLIGVRPQIFPKLSSAFNRLLKVSTEIHSNDQNELTMISIPTFFTTKKHFIIDNLSSLSIHLYNFLV